MLITSTAPLMISAIIYHGLLSCIILSLEVLTPSPEALSNVDNNTAMPHNRRHQESLEQGDNLDKASQVGGFAGKLLHMLLIHRNEDLLTKPKHENTMHLRIPVDVIPQTRYTELQIPYVNQG